MEEDVQQILTWYTTIFFACHTRHVQDPERETVLSAHQASILDHLDEEAGLRLTDLAEHMGVTPSTMTSHINRLVQLGYVEKAVDPDDGRVVRLRLTTDGVRIKLAQSVLDPVRVMAMLQHLNLEERQKALVGLALLGRAAQASMADQARDHAWAKRRS